MQDDHDSRVSRRGALRVGFAAGGTLAALGLIGASTAESARAAAAGGALVPDIADTSHASPRVARLMRDFFIAKSTHDAAALASFYANPDAFFMDAAFGFGAPTWADISGFFTGLFASGLPPEAISYALRVVGDEHGAAVELIDTPEFFNLDLRVLTSLTFDRNLKIVRAVDYWDGRTTQVRNTIGPTYPTDFKDERQNAAPVMVKVTGALQAAFAAGDAAAAARLMSYDVVFEDMAAHTWLRGRTVLQRYLGRSLGQVPYGRGASVLHVNGGRLGGGYEWAAAPATAPLRRGHTAIELDKAGKISRLTTMYDSSVLADDQYRALVALAAEATP